MDMSTSSPTEATDTSSASGDFDYSEYKKCWNCLLGHVGPGAFMFLIGFLHYLRVIGYKPLLKGDRFHYTKILIAIIFGPVSFFFEYINASRIRTDNLHHMMMYTCVTLDAILIYLAKVKHHIPRHFHSIFEPGVILVMANMFAHHSHGNALFVEMHHLLEPTMEITALFLFLSELYSHRLLFHYTFSIVFIADGFWFSYIGWGYFLWGNHGLEGSQHDTSHDKHAMGQAAYYMGCDLLAVTFIVTLLYLVLKQRGQLTNVRPHLGNINYKEYTNDATQDELDSLTSYNRVRTSMDDDDLDDGIEMI